MWDGEPIPIETSARKSIIRGVIIGAFMWAVIGYAIFKLVTAP